MGQIDRRETSAPSRVRRRGHREYGACLVVCLIVAACLEVFSRYAEERELLSVATVESLSILAFLLFAVSVVYGIARACGISRIRWAIILGVLLILLNLGLDEIRVCGLIDVPSGQHRLALFLNVLEEVLWLGGLACLLSGFFFSILGAQAAREELAEEHAELARECEERVRVERALRRSEERFQEVAANAKEWIWEVDAQGLYTYASPVVTRILRYTPEQIVGEKHFYDLFHPEDREEARQNAFAVFADRRPFRDFINRNVTKDGKIVWLSTAGVPIVDEQGELAGYRGADTDVTERKQAEDALRESEAKFRTLAETAPAIIYIYQGNRFQYTNPASTTVTGYAPGEFQQMDFWTLVHPDFRDLVRKRGLARLRGEGVPGEYEFKIVTKAGEERWLSAAATRIEFEGEPAVLGVARDVTDTKRAEEERRQLEAQLQHAQKLESLGVLAGGIAHDFNNLLMGILGNADVALRECPPESAARRSIEEVLSAGRTAADLTSQMLAYSGKGGFVVEPLDLSRLVREIGHLLEVSISKNTSLRYDLAAGLPAVVGDAAQFRQVILNLITNASESIEQSPGVISLSTGVVEADRAYLSGTYLGEGLPETAYVYVRVQDTGCGMDEETLARVFDPFFSTKVTGRGLGLATVLGIVRSHSGTIRIESDLGHGTTFEILFPASARKVEAVEEPAERPGSWHGAGTVLVVDDETIVRNAVKAMLKSLGFTVLTACDGQEGVRTFQERADDICAVVLDLTMPRMGGEEAFHQIRRVRPDVRVILSSGYTESTAADRFGGKGVTGFLQKPYQTAKLVEKLRVALGR